MDGASDDSLSLEQPRPAELTLSYTIVLCVGIFFTQHTVFQALPYGSVISRHFPFDLQSRIPLSEQTLALSFPC